MSLYRLIWRNLLYRKTLSLLSILSIAIAAALLLITYLAQSSAEEGAAKGYGPYELVIGATGSDTQLVLNTFYHLGTPVGNIPYTMYEEVKNNPATDVAYPMTRGDSIHGYPIIGLDAGYFQTRYTEPLVAGNWYTKTGEAVVGSYVAQKLGLSVGDEFHGSHGMIEGLEEHEEHEGTVDHAVAEHAADEHNGTEEHGHEEHAATEEHVASEAQSAQTEGATATTHEEEHDTLDHHHTFTYKIVGILPPLHTADDKGVFTTVDYAWAVHGIEHEEDKMITALLVKPKGLMELQMLKLKYNKFNGAQAVFSSKVVADLLNMIDTGTVIFHFMAIVCLILASISLLLSLFAAAAERRRDVGLLRLLGKSRLFVMNTIVLEGVTLTATGVLLGLLLGHTSAWFLRERIFSLTGIAIDPWVFHPYEATLLLGAICLGVFASLWPSLRMYKVQPIELFR